jgi:hypothetical protein
MLLSSAAISDFRLTEIVAAKVRFSPGQSIDAYCP